MGKDVSTRLKQEVIAGRKKGCICPTCTLYVKEYHRNINSSMVWALALVFDWYQKNDPQLNQWLHVDDYLKDIKDIPASLRGDFGKLRHWGLIEKMADNVEKNPKKKSSGYWRITRKGCHFLNGTVKVDKYAIVFKKTLIRFEGPQISVDDCLNEKFDYSKLMGFM